ncbi:hypothetical protein ACLOJK_015827 [Asimina triloba]
MKSGKLAGRLKRAKEIMLVPDEESKKLHQKRTSSSTDPGKSCQLCFMHYISSDANPGSEPNNPTHQEVGYDNLKSLIERNNFYVKECNVHAAI